MADLADSPVNYRILYHEGGEGGADISGVGSSLAFHVGAGAGGSPSDLVPFLQFVGGTAEAVVIGGVEVQRIVPLTHPYFPGMVAQAVRWRKSGKPLTVAPGWTDWKVSVDFAVVPYGFAGDQPFLTLNRDYGASSITLPGRAYAVGGVFLNHDIARNVPEIVYRATKYNVPSMDDSVYKTLAGKVNASSFLGYDPGTVRFDGVQDQIVRTIAFTLNRTVSLALACRPSMSWNKIVLPNGVVGEPINVNDGVGLYETGDFDALLY